MAQPSQLVSLPWPLLAGFMVMLMQAGFGMVETGFSRVKNATHVFFSAFAVYFVGVMGYWLCGFALQWGGSFSGEASLSFAGQALGFAGFKGFMLGGGGVDGAIFTLFLPQAVFMATAATIPTGAMTERWKTGNLVLFALFMSMLVYPLFGNWTWGGGWLSQLGLFGLGHGFVDYAGASVIHLAGGTAAFVGAWILGPRLGKYDKEGRPVPIPGHHLPLALGGTLILGFGWFGFAAGGLAGLDAGRFAQAAANLLVASAAGAFASMLYIFFKTGRFDPVMTANGFLAGLVAASGAAALVPSASAVAIGIIGGLLACVSCSFIENQLKIDDPVGAISIHAVNGAWGALSVGLFADGRLGVSGLFYGDAGQLAAQVIGIGVCLAWIGGACFLFFKASAAVNGLRVAPDVEIQGLDMTECGTMAYPEFLTKRF